MHILSRSHYVVKTLPSIHILAYTHLYMYSTYFLTYKDYVLSDNKFSIITHLSLYHAVSNYKY